MVPVTGAGHWGGIEVGDAGCADVEGAGLYGCDAFAEAGPAVDEAGLLQRRIPRALAGISS